MTKYCYLHADNTVQKKQGKLQLNIYDVQWVLFIIDKFNKTSALL